MSHAPTPLTFSANEEDRRRLRELFDRAELSTVEALCASARGTIITTARTRLCRRIELEGEVFFVKTQDLARARLPVRKIPSYALRGSPIEREVAALEMLANAGFRTAEVIAHGASRRRFGIPRCAALVTCEVAGHTDLATWSSTAAAADDDCARQSFDAAHALVRRAHDSGIVLLGAKYRNLMVPVEGCTNAEKIVLLDQPSAKRSRSKRLRDKDHRHLAFDRSRYGAGR